MSTPNITPEFVAGQFKQLDQHWAWQAYQKALRDRFEDAMQKALLGVDKLTAEELRVAIAVAAAFQTAMNLPELIFNAVSEEADKVKQEEQGT